MERFSARACSFHSPPNGITSLAISFHPSWATILAGYDQPQNNEPNHQADSQPSYFPSSSLPLRRVFKESSHCMAHRVTHHLI